MTHLYINDKLNREAIIALLDQPDCGIKKLPTSCLKFGSTLDYVRSGENLYYHQDYFRITTDYRILHIESGIVVSDNMGWHWLHDIYKTYDYHGIETVEDLLRVLGEYIEVIKNLPNKVFPS